MLRLTEFFVLSRAMELNKKMRQKERALISALKSTSPSAINNLNYAKGARFAIIYSDEFSELASELVRIYRNGGVKDPLLRLSAALQENGITSCRGAEMSYERVKYFFDKYLDRKLRRHPGYVFPSSFGKEKCSGCGRFFANLSHHLEFCAG